MCVKSLIVTEQRMVGLWLMKDAIETRPRNILFSLGVRNCIGDGIHVFVIFAIQNLDPLNSLKLSIWQRINPNFWGRSTNTGCALYQS